MITTLVRADRLRLAHLFASNEQTRYYLNGAFIEAVEGGGVRIVATDGHVLGVFHDPEGYTSHDCIASLPKDALAAIKRARDPEKVWFGIVGLHEGVGRQEARVLDAENLNLTLDEVAVALADVKNPYIAWSGIVELIDGTFPEYQRVIPSNLAVVNAPQTFNADLIARFGQVASRGRRESAPITIYNGEEGAPALVDCGRPDFIGVIMPMREYGRAFTLKDGVTTEPAWVRQISVAGAARQAEAEANREKQKELDALSEANPRYVEWVKLCADCRAGREGELIGRNVLRTLEFAQNNNDLEGFVAFAKQRWPELAETIDACAGDMLAKAA